MSLDNIRDQIGKYILTDGMSQIVDLGKSHGAWLVDARDGKEYLDLFSMTASMPVGYNHPYVLKNQDRFISSALNKPANSDIYSNEMADFVTTMGRVAQPDYLPYALYVEGGALAVENALKAAFDWKVRKNLADGKGEKGSKIIHFKECFHGRSGYTMSLTDSSDPRKTMYYPQFDWPRIDNPKIHFPLNDESLENVIKAEKKSIDQIKSSLKEFEDEIAGLIIEPIQGEGGDNHFRCEFFKELKSLSKEHEFLLIYDEVQTGVGITGEMWAHQLFTSKYSNCECEINDTSPDIISFGKKTQVCGIFASNRLDEAGSHVFKESNRLNSTWGGNLVDMVRCTVYLEIIESEDLVSKARENGKHLYSGLSMLSQNHSDLVSNIRNKGLFAAFDLPSTEIRSKALELISREGALMLGCGDQSIRFRPHLNISKSEIEHGISMIDKALSKI